MEKADTQIAGLGEFAEVVPGFSIQGRIAHDPEGTHQLLLTRHLRAGVSYAYSAEDELRISPGREANPYELRVGDVLFMSRGTLNRAWVLNRIPERTLVPVSFYVIRPHEGVDGAYLAWYINQPPAQGAIDQIRTGAGTPLVQRSAFQEIQVAVPPLAVQRQIAALGALLAQERELRERLAELTGRLHAAIGRTTIERLRRNGRDGSTEP